MVIEGGEEEEGSEDYSMADENGLQIENSWAIQLFDTVCVVGNWMYLLCT